MHVAGDRKRLVQATTNLLDNASKYTPEGGAIDVAQLRDDAWAAPRVSDNGVGVPPNPDVLERLLRSVALQRRAP